MAKDIKQIQEYNRRKIICAVHGTGDYEEALKLEIKDPLCLITVKNAVFVEGYKCEQDALRVGVFCGHGNQKDVENTIGKEYEIMGKPLTLDRVLLALNQFANSDGIHLSFNIYDSSLIHHKIDSDGDVRDCELSCWNLTKQTLEEQSEETQRAIFKLLGGE